MNRRNTVGTALVVLALVLFTVPAVFPIQPMLVHDTEEVAPASPAELDRENAEIVAYENLSERGQEYYVTALENDGEYRVPLGEGAPEFDYPNQTERRRAYETNNESALRDLVIKRPADDDSLPPADERYFGPDEASDLNETEREQRRQQALRYDAIDTATAEPPLGATPQLLRLAAVLLAVLALGVGGYLLSSK